VIFGTPRTLTAHVAWWPHVTCGIWLAQDLYSWLVPLRRTLQALLAAIATFQPSDLVGLVVFASTVTVAFPPAPMTPANIAHLQQVMMKLKPTCGRLPRVARTREYPVVARAEMACFLFLTRASARPLCLPHASPPRRHPPSALCPAVKTNVITGALEMARAALRDADLGQTSNRMQLGERQNRICLLSDCMPLDPGPTRYMEGGQG